VLPPLVEEPTGECGGRAGAVLLTDYEAGALGTALRKGVAAGLSARLADAGNGSAAAAGVEAALAGAGRVVLDIADPVTGHRALSACRAAGRRVVPLHGCGLHPARRQALGMDGGDSGNDGEETEKAAPAPRETLQRMIAGFGGSAAGVEAASAGAPDAAGVLRGLGEALGGEPAEEPGLRAMNGALRVPRAPVLYAVEALRPAWRSEHAGGAEAAAHPAEALSLVDAGPRGGMSERLKVWLVEAHLLGARAFNWLEADAVLRREYRWWEETCLATAVAFARKRRLKRVLGALAFSLVAEAGQDARPGMREKALYLLEQERGLGLQGNAAGQAGDEEVALRHYYDEPSAACGAPEAQAAMGDFLGCLLAGEAARAVRALEQVCRGEPRLDAFLVGAAARLAGGLGEPAFAVFCEEVAAMPTASLASPLPGMLLGNLVAAQFPDFREAEPARAAESRARALLGPLRAVCAARPGEPRLRRWLLRARATGGAREEAAGLVREVLASGEADLPSAEVSFFLTVRGMEEAGALLEAYPDAGLEAGWYCINRALLRRWRGEEPAAEALAGRTGYACLANMHPARQSPAMRERLEPLLPLGWLEGHLCRALAKAGGRERAGPAASR